MTVRAIRGIARLLSPLPPPSVPIFRAVRPGATSAGVDVYDGGKFKIVGTVKEKGTPSVPVYRRVVLHDQLTGRMLRVTWSNPVTGAYQFLNIRAGLYYVVTFDHTATAYRAVIADSQVSEVM